MKIGVEEKKDIVVVKEESTISLILKTIMAVCFTILTVSGATVALLLTMYFMGV